MKKNLILSFFALSMAMTSCNKSDASGVKIDFTKSYEDAASALEIAKKNLDDAIKTGDAQAIASAKTALEEAQKKYEASKTDFVNQGGKVNATYEKVLNDTKEAIKNTALPAVGTEVKNAAQNAADNVANTVKEGVKAEINQSVDKARQDLKNAGDKAKADVQAKVDQSKAEVQKKIDQSKADLKAKNEEAKKKVDAEVKKAQDKLNQFLDQK